MIVTHPCVSHDDDDDDEFRFNDASTHEGHLRQNGKLTWFCNETAIKVSHICIKCKTRTNLKRTEYYLQLHFQISISGHLFERIDVAHERNQCSRSGSVSP